MSAKPQYARLMENAEARGDRYLEFELKDWSASARSQVVNFLQARGWRLIGATPMRGPFRGIFRKPATIVQYTFTRQ